MAVRNESRRASVSTDARRLALLAAGDVGVFLVFAALGRRSHGEAAGIAAVGQVLETAAPFVIGWLAIAPLVGAFRLGTLENPKVLLGRSLLAWLLALPVGLLLRMLIRQSAFPPISFAVTTFLIVGVLLGAWRGGFAWWQRRGTRNGD